MFYASNSFIELQRELERVRAGREQAYRERDEARAAGFWAGHEKGWDEGFDAGWDDRPDLAPIDWPARFRAAAEVATEQGGWAIRLPDLLQAIARELECGAELHVVEAVGRALLGDGGQDR